MVRKFNGAYRRYKLKHVMLRCLMIGLFFFMAESVSVADTPEPNTSEAFVSVTLTIAPNTLTKGDTFYEVIDVCGEKARPVEVIGPVAEDSEGLCMNITTTCSVKVLQIQNLQSLKPDLKFQVTYNPLGDWNNNEPPKGNFKFIARCLPIISEDLITIDAQVVARSNAKTVFVTSETYTGDLDGFLGADAKCNTLAQEAELLGTFKAWISIGSRFGYTGPGSFEETLNPSTFPYARVDGVIIADDHEDLFDCSPDCLKAKINVDENRNIITSHPFLAWVGGDHFTNSCDNWQSTKDTNSYYRSRIKGITGSITSIDRKWRDTGGYQACNRQAHLYCFQQ